MEMGNLPHRQGDAEMAVANAADYRITVSVWEDFSMVTCPVCNGAIDVDEEDVDEGDSISCDECGADLKVVGTDPLELESAEEADEDEDEDEDYVEEEEEESEEDWR
jgi:alpha-aminoadipate carrier protein LysW